MQLNRGNDSTYVTVFIELIHRRNGLITVQPNSANAQTMSKLEQTLTAEALLVPLKTARAARQNIKTARVGRDVVEGAVRALEKLGFRIEAEGVVSLTISGKRETFENVFRIQFKEEKHDLFGEEVKGAQVTYYAPIGKPIIPEDLQSLVHDVVFPVPPTIM